MGSESVLETRGVAIIRGGGDGQYRTVLPCLEVTAALKTPPVTHTIHMENIGTMELSFWGY